MTTRSDIIDRHAARVLVLDPDDRLLLFRYEEPGADRSFWITPGGGLEPNETHEDAALRELREETGLTTVSLGPCVWTRSHTFPWLGKTYRQHERFYLLRVAEPALAFTGLTEEEKVVLQEHRWWSAAQIQAAESETFAPSRLGQALASLIQQPLPSEPVDVGA